MMINYWILRSRSMGLNPSLIGGSDGFVMSLCVL